MCCAARSMLAKLPNGRRRWTRPSPNGSASGYTRTSRRRVRQALRRVNKPHLPHRLRQPLQSRGPRPRSPACGRAGAMRCWAAVPPGPHAGGQQGHSPGSSASLWCWARCARRCGGPNPTWTDHRCGLAPVSKGGADARVQRSVSPTPRRAAEALAAALRVAGLQPGVYRDADAPASRVVLVDVDIDAEQLDAAGRVFEQHGLRRPALVGLARVVFEKTR